jgi:hypothetical protein
MNFRRDRRRRPIGISQSCPAELSQQQLLISIDTHFLCRLAECNIPVRKELKEGRKKLLKREVKKSNPERSSFSFFLSFPLYKKKKKKKVRPSMDHVQHHHIEPKLSSESSTLSHVLAHILFCFA